MIDIKLYATKSETGAAAAAFGAKAIAVACAAMLHALARHRAIGVLTLIYLAAAVWPWTRIIWS